MTPDKGILIIAQGKQRYLDMAVNIAISLRLSNPETSLALVTDVPSALHRKLYDHIIPIDESLGVGFVQKVNMYKYSPFRETLFIDVDCVVLKNIDFIWNGMKGKPVGVLGFKVFSGNFIGTTIESLKSEFKFEFLPSFNGGVYYFERNEQAKLIFDKAIEIFKNKYHELGLGCFDGRPGDEPVMSIAIGVAGIDPLEDTEGKGMYTPVGQHGQFKMDVLKGYCQFMKREKKVTPAIMHFGGGYPEAFHYRREKAKLKLVYYYKFPKWLSSFLVNATWNPSYIVYVFVYRIIKKIVKGGKLKLTPIMPMFRFE